MEYVCSDKQEFAQRLRDLGLLKADDAVLDDGLLEGFARASEIPPEGPPVGFAMRFGRWAIRKDDLDIFGTVRDATVTLASAKFVVGNLSASGVAALAFGLVKLLRNIRAKGIALSAEQA